MGSLRTRIAAGLVSALAVAASVALFACGGTPRAAERAYLAIECEPDNASVYVDEHFVATAQKLARRPAAVRIGVHRLTVTAPGHFPHDVELDLPKGETKVRLVLRPIPP